MDPTQPFTWIAITGAFLVGGTVKGFAGLGLPLVTVSVLSFLFDLPSAMALMLVPGLATNAYQAVAGGALREAVERTWRFLVACLLAIWLGTAVLVAFEPDRIVIALGVVLSVYALSAIIGFRLIVPPHLHNRTGWFVGAINGVSAGMTGVTSVPSVLWLNGIGLSRPALIQAMGLLFGLSYAVLTVAFWWRGLVNLEIGSLSVFALLPSVAGFWLGARLRSRLSEARFRRIFDWVLLAVGCYLIVRAGRA